MWGDSGYKANENLQRLLEKLRVDEGGFISKKTFVDSMKENSVILSPLMMFILKLRETFGGEQFWNRLTSDRENNFGFSKSIFDILEFDKHKEIILYMYRS